MLQVTIPASEYFDEKTGEFSSIRETTLQLEHSLLSVSKWESKWRKPFLGPTEKTAEECIDYVRCMTITQHVDPELSIPEVVSGGMEAVYTAIQNGKSQFARSISQLISAGEKAARSTYSNWHRVGQQLSIGISNGIVSMAGSVRRAAINTASGAIRAISITWAVHSPSRVGRELGMNLDLGIAEGIGDYSRMVSAQATNMSESAVTAAKSMLTGADSSIFDCLDPTPTIRPVLDLSNVQSGISTIGDMFTSSSMMSSDLFQGVSFNRNAGMLNFDGAKILGSQNNKDVVGELRVLSDRFNTLSEAVTNMQLVLDTGVLVGQTSARMDRQLGVQAMRRGRGN